MKWLVVFIAWITAFGGFSLWKTWPDQYLHLVFCDVGQGDATLIKLGWAQVLIDAGIDDKVLDCLSEHMPIVDSQIEMMVATHADADHIGGIAAVLKRYRVPTIMLTDQSKSTGLFLEFEKAVQAEAEVGAHLIRPQVGQQWQLHASETQILNFKVVSAYQGEAETQLSDKNSENAGKSENYNDGSIVLLLKYIRFGTLLMADLEEKGELAMIDGGLTDDVDLLKIGHHGSKTSSRLDFLQAVQPEVSVISAGKDNRYGHPDAGVMQRLSALGSEIWRTDTEGTIEVITDGEVYWRTKPPSNQ